MRQATNQTDAASDSTIHHQDRVGRSRQQSSLSSRVKPTGSGALRTRGNRLTTASKQQLHQQVAATILQRRERLRVYDEGEDVTPRTLAHPLYASLDERRTAFDTIGHLGSSQPGSLAHLAGAASAAQQRTSLATVSSFSSIYTIDEILAAGGHSDSFVSSARGSLRGSTRQLDVLEDDEDAPSQFHVPRLDSRERFALDDKVTITLKETETLFLFDLPQLTEDATTEAGRAVAEENERYSQLMSGAGRKTVDAETQTPQFYTKSRGTYVGREERRNRATFVNNWVMHDTYANEKERKERGAAGEPHEDSRFKFADASTGDEPLSRRPVHEQLTTLAKEEAYANATRITLRILASKNFEVAQKRFAGLLRQDPCDPDLELVYGLELLWQHECPAGQRRPVASFRWNPVNRSLLAVGYGASSNEETPNGAVLIWCAKNPTEPDRCYEFNSPVSDLDWSISRPNLLAIGFYNGIIRVINVSKKELTVIRQSRRKTSPSYEPHWQVQWWPVGNEMFYAQTREQLYTSNQDGRISYYPPDEDFASREILHLQRIVGKIPGVKRMNYCQGHEVPISRSPGALLLRRHPAQPGIYLVGTEEGCVLRCATSHPHGHLDSFLAHDGPIYGLEFSPFCSRLLLTCGADWCARIWAEGLDEPLLTFGTKMACVSSAAWSPRNSTIFASAVDNEICIWDIRRKTHRPASVTKVAEPGVRIVQLDFTRSGEQLVAADDKGTIHVYDLVGIPLPPFDQTRSLVQAMRKGLLTKPEVLHRFEKLGKPFTE